MWTTVASVVSQGGTYACSIIIARILGREIFGQYAMIQTNVASMVNFAGLGLGIISTKYASQMRTTDPSRLGRILGLCSTATLATGGLFAGVVLVGAPSIAHVLFRAPHLATEMRIASVYLLFITMNVYQLGTLVGFEAFRSIARVNLTQSVTAVVLSLGLTMAFGLRGAVTALALSGVSVWAYYQVMLRRECRNRNVRISYTNMGAEREVITGAAVPASLSGLISAACVWFGNVLLARQPSGFSELGMFGAAFTLRTLVVYVPQLTTRVVGPILCNLQAEGEKTKYRQAFWMNVKINTALSALAAIVLGFGSSFLLRLFGKEFTGGEWIVALLLASAVAEVAACGVAQVWFSHGKFWWGLASQVAGGGSALAVMFIEIPRYGAAGLAASFVARWTIVLIAVISMAHRLLRRGVLAPDASTAEDE